MEVLTRRVDLARFDVDFHLLQPGIGCVAIDKLHIDINVLTRVRSFNRASLSSPRITVAIPGCLPCRLGPVQLAVPRNSRIEDERLIWRNQTLSFDELIAGYTRFEYSKGRLP
jgi:hypothetical protein